MSNAFLLHPARRATGGASHGRRFLRGGHARRSSLTLAVRLAIVWGLALLALIVGLMLTLPTLARAEAKPSDPKAVKIADEVMKALGGEKAWNDLPGLRWSFGSSVNDTVRSTRRHAWNKHTGWHRIEGVNRAGVTFCWIENLNTREGMAWMNGTPIEGDSLKKLLARAHSVWINDSYWMLMPYKMRDPGVTLQYAGDERANDIIWDKIQMTFDHVGDTPGDTYWVYVNRKTHRVERWDMVLQDDQPPPKTYSWEGWEEHDKLWFPTAHRQDKVNVFTNGVETVREFRPTEFTAP